MLASVDCIMEGGGVKEMDAVCEKIRWSGGLRGVGGVGE